MEIRVFETTTLAARPQFSRRAPRARDRPRVFFDATCGARYDKTCRLLQKSDIHGVSGHAVMGQGACCRDSTLKYFSFVGQAALSDPRASRPLPAVGPGRAERRHLAACRPSLPAAGLGRPAELTWSWQGLRGPRLPPWLLPSARQCPRNLPDERQMCRAAAGQAPARAGRLVAEELRTFASVARRLQASRPVPKAARSGCY